MLKRNLIWLASYPKSGNTWFRAFLSALLNDSGDIDINGLKTNAIFSSRDIFEAFTDLDSTYLYDEEVKRDIPLVFQQLSEESETSQYIKIHDAYTLNDNNEPIVPAASTKCALYFIRNPLDIVASFANHIAAPTGTALSIMNNPKGCISAQPNNLNTVNQFRQLMLSWSGHVESWTSDLPFPVMVIRYEDMLHDTFNSFTKAVEFIGLDVSPERIHAALEATSFKKLQEKEIAFGFREKRPRTERFFRAGVAGNWKNELTAEQAISVISHHSHIMKRYGYDVDISDVYNNMQKAL